MRYTHCRDSIYMSSYFDTAVPHMFCVPESVSDIASRRCKVENLTQSILRSGLRAFRHTRPTLGSI